MLIMCGPKVEHQGVGGGEATRVHLEQFFEKTHSEGIQCVKVIPIMNGLPSMYP